MSRGSLSYAAYDVAGHLLGLAALPLLPFLLLTRHGLTTDMSTIDHQEEMPEPELLQLRVAWPVVREFGGRIARFDECGCSLLPNDIEVLLRTACDASEITVLMELQETSRKRLP